MQRGYPAMAVEIQDALGIDGFGFDMNVACSSATFGNGAPTGLARPGMFKELKKIHAAPVMENKR